MMSDPVTDPKIVELELALLRAPTRYDPDFLEPCSTTA